MLRSLMYLAFILSPLSTGQAELTIGTEFVLAFHCAYDGAPSDPESISYYPSLFVINSNSNQAVITLTSSMSGFTTLTRTVASNSASQIRFKDAVANVYALLVCEAGVAKQQGLRVQSSVPVALYARYDGTQTDNSDDFGDVRQFLVLPTKFLASQYVHTTGTDHGSYSGIIVALHDGTQLTVGGRQITLNQLMVYKSNLAITSASAPFAYIIECSFQNRGNDCPDATMALPKTAASTFVFSTPLQYPDSHVTLYYNIFALVNGTQVSNNGGRNVTVNVGNPYQLAIDLDRGESFALTASNPIQVVEACSLNLLFDTLVNVPETFLSTSVQFPTYDSIYPDDTPGDGDIQMLRIVAPRSSTGNILLDGQAISALLYRRIPNTDYYYYTQQLIPGPLKLYTISTSTPNDRYFATVRLPSLKDYVIALNLTVNT